jgi:hypothetical protein
MLPKHKSPRWLRLLKAQGAQTYNWINFKEGWPKAWHAQSQLVPIIDVLFVTLGQGQGLPGGRGGLGRCLGLLAWKHVYDALAQTYGTNKTFETAYVEVCGLAKVDEDIVQGYFTQPFGPRTLLGDVARLWNNLIQLDQDRSRFPPMEYVVHNLAALNYQTYGKVHEAKASVIAGLRGTYGLPKLL